MAVAALAAAIPAFTQTATSDTAPTSDQKSKPRVVEVLHADIMRSVGSVRILEGHVHIKEGETHFYADRITYDDDAKKGEAVPVPSIKGGSVGNPHAEDSLNSLTADRMTLDFSPKEARLKVVSALGHVRFVAKPKPGAKGEKPAATPADSRSGSLSAPANTPAESKRDRLQDRVKEETVLTCNRLDYYYRTKKAVAAEGLKVTQGKRWLTGDQAIYYDKYDTVVVNGNVKGEDEKGRTFEANSLKVVTSGPSDTVEANTFHGTFTLDEEEDAQEEPDDVPPSLEINPSLPSSPAPKGSG
jgi:lipopolysaccharide assembly outer membrane protein LptD (OstA)